MKILADIKIKKRIPNIIAGLFVGLLGIKLSPSIWTYFLYIISAVLFVFADQIIKSFVIDLDEQVDIKENIKVKKDKNRDT